MKDPLIENLTEELERLRSLSKDVVDAWDWWLVDEYDRCQSVPGDAIENLRKEVGNYSND